MDKYIFSWVWVVDEKFRLEDLYSSFLSFLCKIASINITTNKIYASRNSLIYLDEKGFLNIYNEDTNSFDVMYQKTLLKEIIKYFSLFVIGMTLFYIILSFIESNKRYNLYFKVNKAK